ncbi:hypothetical protein ACKKBG_A28530 [Auxenochlorella protothecoides x Auxenochlorella symbiontica]
MTSLHLVCVTCGRGVSPSLSRVTPSRPAIRRSFTQNRPSRAAPRAAGSAAPHRFDAPRYRKPPPLLPYQLQQALLHGDAAGTLTLLSPCPGHAWDEAAAWAGDRGSLPALRCLLEARARSGLDPGDPKWVTRVVTSLRRAGAPLAEAWAVFCTTPTPTLYTCNAIIAACARARDWPRAHEVLQGMRVWHVAPDVVTFNSLLQAAGAGGSLAGVRATLGALRSASLAPTPTTYAVLFTALAAAGLRDADELWALLRAAGEGGLRPTPHMVSAFLAALRRTAPRDDQVADAVALVDALPWPGENEVTALLSLLRHRPGAAPRHVPALWRAIQASPELQTPHVFSSLFAACAHAGAGSGLDALAQEAYELMRGLYLRRAPTSGKAREAALLAFNAAAHALSMGGRAEAARAVEGDMLAVGVTPDAATLSILVSSHGAAGDGAGAAAAFDRLVAAHAIPPGAAAFGSLLAAQARAGDLARASAAWRRMRAARVRPNARHYASLMRACEADGSPRALRRALALLRAMRAEGVPRSPAAYAGALRAARALRDAGAVLALYAEACREGLATDPGAAGTLVAACTEAGRLDEALGWAKTLLRAHAAIDAGALCALTRALAAREPERALRMLGLLRAQGVEAGPETLAAVVGGCAALGRAQDAWDVYAELRRVGGRAGRDVATRLVVALARAGQLAEAEAVWGHFINEAQSLHDTGRQGGLAAGAGSSDASASEDGAGAASRPPPDVIPEAASRDASAVVSPPSRQLPGASAAAALALACLETPGHLADGWAYFRALAEEYPPVAQAATLLPFRRAWEAAAMAACRAGRLQDALLALDAWQAASDAWHAGRLGREERGQEPGADSVRSRRRSRRLADLGGGGATMQGPGARGVQDGAEATPAAASEGSDGAEAGGPTGGGHESPPATSVPALAPKPVRLASSAAPGLARAPRLSSATLAYLAACCHRAPAGAETARVLQLCAMLRTRRQEAMEAAQPHPPKRSHHFYQDGAL